MCKIILPLCGGLINFSLLSALVFCALVGNVRWHSVTGSSGYKRESTCCGHTCPWTAMTEASMAVLEEESSETAVWFCLLARELLSSSN